jgi:hypothetical protein
MVLGHGHGPASELVGCLHVSKDHLGSECWSAVPARRLTLPAPFLLTPISPSDSLDNCAGLVLRFPIPLPLSLTHTPNRLTSPTRSRSETQSQFPDQARYNAPCHVYPPLTPLSSQGGRTVHPLSSLHGSGRAGGNGSRPRFACQGERKFGAFGAFEAFGGFGAGCGAGSVDEIWEKRRARSGSASESARPEFREVRVSAMSARSAGSSGLVKSYRPAGLVGSAWLKLSGRPCGLRDGSG